MGSEIVENKTTETIFKKRATDCPFQKTRTESNPH